MELQQYILLSRSDGIGAGHFIFRNIDTDATYPRHARSHAIDIYWMAGASFIEIGRFTILTKG